MGEADGQEVLIVDGDDKVQRGMAQLLSSVGLVPTVLSDPARARALVREKYFPVALLDLDTPQPGDGLELVRWLKKEAPNTKLFVMASRKEFESVVEAFRAGATDLVLKAPDQVDYLKQRVIQASTEARTRTLNDQLIGEVLALHEEFLKRLMESSRRSAELEEQHGGGSHPSHADAPHCAVLVVEPHEHDWLAGELGALLEGRKDYQLRFCGSGGEGLDYASRERFEIALICHPLPDLPSTMLINACKTQSPDAIIISYAQPGARPGKADIVDGQRSISLVAELTDVRQILARIDELREAARRTSRERRYLASFRQENYELLRRYAELKQKLGRAKP